jgi:hypothetical protein
MKLRQVEPEVVAQIRELRYDRIIEKHEGPEHWDSQFVYGNPELICFDGKHHILLPVDQASHEHISLIKQVISDDEKTLVLFLKDTTHSRNAEDHWFEAGRVAVCNQIEPQPIYVAIVYHEWFMTFGTK